MESEELEKIANKLVERGLSEHLENGDDAIVVSLTTPHKMPALSRVERKELLRQEFQQKLGHLSGIEVDFGSLSVSGQTITAKVGIPYLDSLLQLLKKEKIDVHPVYKQQIV